MKDSFDKDAFQAACESTFTSLFLAATEQYLVDTGRNPTHVVIGQNETALFSFMIGDFKLVGPIQLFGVTIIFSEKTTLILPCNLSPR